MLGPQTKGEFGDRLEKLAVRVITMTNALPRTAAGRHVGVQLLRSGTSPGANYCEARCAESRADFAHKMQIVVKELRETLYWIELCRNTHLLKPTRLAGIAGEVNELISIGVKSVVTAKSNRRTER